MFFIIIKLIKKINRKEKEFINHICESYNLPINALYLINTNFNYNGYTYIIYNIYIIRISNLIEYWWEMWVFGELCIGMLRGEGDFDGLRAIGNGSLWGDGDYDGGGSGL